jgi:mono/diheme cytochrome c family protein
MDPNILLAGASLVLFVGFIAYFAYLIYHQEKVDPEEKPVYGLELLQQHYAPGDTVEQPTPYWVAPIPAAPDPLEISANLDRKIIAGGAMLFALIGLIGGYFLLQIVPASVNLRALGAERQLHASIERGKNLYANFCYGCHGKLGGGSSEISEVTKEPLPGKPLNVPANKHETLQGDPQALQEREQFLRRTITRGVLRPAPQYSMPAWGQSEGGPFNPEQVTQLVNFIMRGTDEDWAEIVEIRTHLEGVDNEFADPGPRPQPASGAELTQQYCVTCHSFQANVPSILPQAPNLSRYGVEGPINDENKRAKDSGDADWLFKWISNAPKVKPGISMPVFNQADGGQLTEANIRLLVEYLSGLGK